MAGLIWGIKLVFYILCYKKQTMLTKRVSFYQELMLPSQKFWSFIRLSYDLRFKL